MAKIISILNQKGGVGKTTSSMNIGSWMSILGYKVLIIDLDPQANLTAGFGITNPEYTIYGTLLNEYPIKAYEVEKNISIVASTPALSGLERSLANDIDKEFSLHEKLKTVSGNFDVIILDCPPSLGLITINALVASNSVYTPLEAQLFSTDGLTKVFEMIDKIQKRLNPTLNLSGIFFTRYDKRKILKRDILESITEQYPELILHANIRENISLSEAPHVGKDIFRYDHDAIGCVDYSKLAEVILKRENLTQYLD
jgi:chromosome partitioning protein